MISASDRQQAITLIAEAVAAGARETKACEVLHLSHRTLQRWRSKQSPDTDQRPHAKRPVPANKLTPEEEAQIIDVIHQPAYQSLPPSQIVPKLADAGEYVASESTFYRVMHRHKLQHHRGRSTAPTRRQPTSHCASKPNQVWMWDITWLPGPVKGLFFYLYLILDLYSRKVVAWEVWTQESSEHASQLVRRAIVSEQCVLRREPLILHSDNGSPMKGATLLETLNQLGITPSRSRPRVSNDNPYAESVFRACKYRPEFPVQGFATLSEAREWTKRFVNWYNTEHRHSSLKFLTPEQRHQGRTEAILARRKAVYEQAKLRHPNRWSGSTRDWTLEETVWLNPERTSFAPQEQQSSS